MSNRFLSAVVPLIDPASARPFAATECLAPDQLAGVRNQFAAKHAFRWFALSEIGGEVEAGSFWVCVFRHQRRYTRTRPLSGPAPWRGVCDLRVRQEDQRGRCDGLFASRAADERRCQCSPKRAPKDTGSRRDTLRRSIFSATRPGRQFARRVIVQKVDWRCRDGRATTSEP